MSEHEGMMTRDVACDALVAAICARLHEGEQLTVWEVDPSDRRHPGATWCAMVWRPPQEPMLECTSETRLTALAGILHLTAVNARIMIGSEHYQRELAPTAAHELAQLMDAEREEER